MPHSGVWRYVAGLSVIALVVAAAVLVFAVSRPAAPSANPTSGAALGPSAASDAGPVRLASLGRETVGVGGERLLVAVALTQAEWTTGLQGVTDLGSLDGMLFVFPQPTDTRFWMKDTLIPLDIAFFDPTGELVTVLTMPLCVADPCPTYGAARPYRWALETAAGRLSGLPSTARLSIERG